MHNDPGKPAYKSVRLRYAYYDECYAYSLTLVSAGRHCIFGRIESGEMIANDFGQIVIEEWLRSTVIRPELQLDAFALMPNHFHGIVLLTDARAHIHAALRPALPRQSRERTPRSISTFVSGFKGTVAARINTIRDAPGTPVWQPSFHEHIIRTERELAGLREYILNNPRQWELDHENPEFKSAPIPAP